MVVLVVLRVVLVLLVVFAQVLLLVWLVVVVWQAPGLLLPVCGLGLRGDCLVD